MNPKIRQKLRDELVDHKCIASDNYGKEDPFVSVYFETLCFIIDKIYKEND